METPALLAGKTSRFTRRRPSNLSNVDASGLVKRYWLIFAGVTLLTLLISYFFALRPANSKLQEVRLQADAAEARVVQLNAQLAHLQALQRAEPQLREQARKLDEAIPQEMHLAKFILQVEDVSNKASLNWVSAAPTPAAASGAGQGLMELAIAMSAEGSYAAVQDFLERLENLDRAVRIGSLTLSLNETTSTLTADIGLKMFFAPTLAPALPAAPAPAGAPTGTPATLPSPSTPAPARVSASGPANGPVAAGPAG